MLRACVSFFSRPASSVRGFVLFDSLLALALLALALLLASYPLYKARDAWKDAGVKLHAVHLAANAIDRIRLNASIATDMGRNYADASLWSGSTSVVCGADCTPAQLIQRDAAELREEFAQHHHQGRMRVRRCNGALCVTLWWNDSLAGTANCNAPQCLTIRFLP